MDIPFDTDFSCLHPRDEILDLMQRIYGYRMTTTSGGNLSLREPDGAIWITPARVDKGALSRDDMVCVRKGSVAEGFRPPSSELPLHQAIYETRPDLAGIVHAHPVALVAFSLVRQVPNTRLFPQAWHVCGEPAFAPYQLPGSRKLGNAVAHAFSTGANCVILENHGVVTGGVTLQEAFQRFETLEFTGKAVIKASLIGEPRYLTDEELALPAHKQVHLDEFEPSGIPSRERELRRQLSAFVRRAYRQRLFISTWGSFSVRTGEDSFLITPYRGDRGRISPQDLVLICGGAAEAGKLPSRAAVIHRAIYRRHSGINSIVNAYPVNATAFSVTGAPLATRTIPESYVVARNVGCVPYGVQFEDWEAVAGVLSDSTPAVLLANDGVLVTGSSILEAFDRLEVVESTAEAVINSRALGTLSPMPDEAIQELERTFFGI